MENENFCKIFDTEKLGQVLVVAGFGEDGITPAFNVSMSMINGVILTISTPRLTDHEGTPMRIDEAGKYVEALANYYTEVVFDSIQRTQLQGEE